jgi:hypothetical protein
MIQSINNWKENKKYKMRLDKINIFNQNNFDRNKILNNIKHRIKESRKEENRLVNDSYCIYNQ